MSRFLLLVLLIQTTIARPQPKSCIDTRPQPLSLLPLETDMKPSSEQEHREIAKFEERSVTDAVQPRNATEFTIEADSTASEEGNVNEAVEEAHATEAPVGPESTTSEASPMEEGSGIAEMLFDRPVPESCIDTESRLPIERREIALEEGSGIVVLAAAEDTIEVESNTIEASGEPEMEEGSGFVERSLPRSCFDPPELRPIGGRREIAERTELVEHLPLAILGLEIGEARVFKTARRDIGDIVEGSGTEPLDGLRLVERHSGKAPVFKTHRDIGDIVEGSETEPLDGPRLVERDSGKAPVFKTREIEHPKHVEEHGRKEGKESAKPKQLEKELEEQHEVKLPEIEAADCSGMPGDQPRMKIESTKPKRIHKTPGSKKDKENKKNL